MDQVKLLQQKEAANITRMRNKVRNELLLDNRRQEVSDKIMQKQDRL